MTDLSEAERAALKKLEEIGAKIFTEEEFVAVKRIIARERAWMSVGFLANQFKNIMTLLGFIIGTIILIKSQLIQWLNTVVSGGG